MTPAPQTEPGSAGGHAVALPRVALGCGSFGGLGSQTALFGQGMTDDEAAAMMDAAWEQGITHFDTADAYGGGRSEQAIGRWIASRGVRPTLTTKTFHPMAAGADAGLAPERIARQLPLSLQRLGVDHVELYLAHAHDPVVPLRESLDALAQLQTAGLVGAYGVSNFDGGQLCEALADGAPAAVQNDYSLLHRDDEREVIGLCAEHGLAYLAYSPLSGGWLTGKYRRGAAYPAGSRMTQLPGPYERLTGDATFTALEALEAFAAARDRTMAGTALAWLLADPRIAQVVVGPSRPAHLAPVAEAVARPLTDGERDALAAIF
jgi:aryl-alcohol dehydrogenase-like predicted oxidoreductase